ncbi:Uma2 family endonuclease [Oharaeibacter diazotrophicus]|uniref:Uma2 family endonuclease n=1 Tax=Oharaeibacter diazotrophicus TaxID=1920512 RepID=A0A4V3CVJ1_9HYPH|nr:Uma2 family endonuclease [Oharaeibacter diazotrophicus]TDP82668.1 Uma2 family endonuclease [Oharaeibacter diazotrophicus]BBE72570.1 hypothetical protein OHA_1_02167 [Pleomorphomonas sp. SM30]GLS76600.1 hypothetical protein GCM10007904_19370 [Oharaeibacter diazotrophicus]
MNKPVVIAQDGLPRRLFSVADVDRMVEAGIIGHDERVEIVDGEILPMSPKGPLHETFKQHLTIHFARNLPAGTTFIQEAGWRLGEMLYLEPDYLFFPDRLGIATVGGPDALLVVEVADTSLGYDAGRKVELYARLGVREYWVVEARTRETRVHREPDGGHFGRRFVAGPDDVLAPHLLAGLTLRLSDLPL